MYSECETDKTEYYVSLITGGTDPLTMGITKTKKLFNEAAARFFYKFMLSIAHKKPIELLEYFVERTKLSQVLYVGQQIQHCVKKANGGISVRIGVFDGVKIRHGEQAYTSLNAFIVKHYKDENPSRKPGNGWKECEARVEKDWFKLSVLRAIS
jgi:hypothetical protein